MIFKTRTDMVAALPKNMKIVELGVFRGQFSEEILKVCQPNELHLVDIWDGFMGSGDKDGKNVTNVPDMYLQYLQIVEKYKNEKNVFIHRVPSLTFLNWFSNNYFDLIYIDADHRYQAVINDLVVSFQKSKKFIGGHDYIINSEIKAAVDTFCNHTGNRLHSVTEDGCPSFLFVKP